MPSALSCRQISIIKYVFNATTNKNPPTRVTSELCDPKIIPLNSWYI